jgi:predicted transcriptional regulator
MNTKSDRKVAATPAGAQQDVKARLEALEISRGLAEIKAGHYIGEADFEAWLDRLETDPDASLPAHRPAST